MNDSSYDKPMLSNEQNAELSDMFRLMGDPTRLRIAFTCLDRKITVPEIAAELALSPSLVNHHLKLLRSAHLVRAEKGGKDLSYTVSDPHVRTVLLSMAQHVREPHSEIEDDEAPPAPPKADAARG